MFRAVETLAESPPAVMNKMPAYIPITTAAKPIAHAIQPTNPMIVVTKVAVLVIVPCVPKEPELIPPVGVIVEVGACANATLESEIANANTNMIDNTFFI